MEKISLYFVLIAVIFSCSSDDNRSDSTQDPQVPETILYDLNEDLADDFKLEYRLGVWDGIRASGLVYSGRLEALGENRLLSEYEENVSTTFLFVKMGDTIRSNVSTPQSWDNRARLIELWQDGNGAWAKEWEIESKKESGAYYVGVQINTNDEFLIGCLKLEIDKKTGKIDIVDQDLVSEDFIVIDR